MKLYHKGYLNVNKKNNWRISENSGGGALLDLGVHFIDVILFTLGNISSVECNSRIFFKERTKVDEIAECKFTLDNGLQGSLEVARIFADMEEPTTINIYGTKGSIKLNSNKPYSIEVYDFVKNGVTVKSANDNKTLLKNYPAQRNSLGYHQDCHMASLVNFANEIYFNCKNPITPTFMDALKAQKVIEAAYVSDMEKRKVDGHAIFIRYSKFKRY